jgi:hypothetical protein
MGFCQEVSLFVLRLLWMNKMVWLNGNFFAGLSQKMNARRHLGGSWLMMVHKNLTGADWSHRTGDRGILFADNADAD